MVIGLPKEIKNHENRVGLTPANVLMLTQAGHSVRVQSSAGEGSGFSDEEYVASGATIVADGASAWDAQMVVKVKEPQPSEYGYFKEGMLLYTYLHLAAEPALTKALMEKGVSAVAYETVQLSDRSLPLLAPMSEVAGRRAVNVASTFLEKHHGGKGILLSGVPGTARAHVVIVGAGVAGLSAARMAYGLGARVTILDVNLTRLRYIDDTYHDIQTLYSNEYNLAEVVKSADVLISTILIPGTKAPKIVKEYMVASMSKGSIVIDVAIDQGGSVESIDRITSHDNPVYEKHGVLHYSVANMPGATPRTSTFALTNATSAYLLALANHGVLACKENPALLLGLNTHKGKLTYKAVADALGMTYTEISSLF
ncbi:alanine dehydrogenase [Spirochaetales bacterium BR151]|uniref:Alanine dehydrogenase n=2 Tax=Entomospira culicis TaxID=2719989 RepID=A0A968GHA9_9SPIO|nr:alanine dehydrogenase [Entomospira culicis]NIZ68984.1 alanine dehydrogenase [Entomospira culicis]